MKNIKAWHTYNTDENWTPVTDLIEFETVEEAMAMVYEWMHTDGMNTLTVLVTTCEGVVFDYDPHGV